MVPEDIRASPDGLFPGRGGFLPTLQQEQRLSQTVVGPKERWVYGRSLSASSIALTSQFCRCSGGEDQFGAYDAVSYSWQGPVTWGQAPQFHTIVTTYRDIPVVAFTQVWPDGANATAADSKDGVISSFPSFDPPADSVP